VKVIAFDIAGATGIAFGVAGGTPRATTVDLGKKLSEAQRFSKMIQTARFFLNKFEPDIVVYEAPVGGPKTSHFLVGVAACFVGEATRLGYDPKSVNLASVRSHFLGKHLTTRHFPHLKPAAAKAEIKRAVVARCFALGWPVKGHDDADALACWDYASATLGRAQAAPTGGLFNASGRQVR
jgi:hypothetical protein